MLVQLNDVLSLGQHRVWKRMAVKWCEASTGQYVLDVCCGSGDLAFRLAEAVGPAGQVIIPVCLGQGYTLYVGDAVCELVKSQIQLCLAARLWG